MISEEDIRLLAASELARRRQEKRLDVDRVIHLIDEHFIRDPKSCLPRGKVQEFVRRCLGYMSMPQKAFQLRMNEMMPKLGFPLGSQHNNVYVYRGLRWKASS